MQYKVTWESNVDKQLNALPSHIRDKFIAWVMVIERIGISEIRKQSGYHDEPLKGKRKGQRSIRFNKAYRAIYIESKNADVFIVEVIGVSKHEY